MLNKYTFWLSQLEAEISEAALLLQILAQKATGLREVRPPTGKPTGINFLR